MLLTIQISPEQEHFLKVLAQQKQVSIESLVSGFITTLSENLEDDGNFDEDFAMMCAEIDAILSAGVPPLPIDFSRADIYFDHD